MIKGIESVLLSSESAKKLAEFYREVVGLEQGEVVEMGENNEEGYEFKTGTVGIFIMDHSGIKGKNTQGARVMFNLEVDDIEKEVERVKGAGAKVITETYHLEGYGYIATFEDVDGNYFQFVQVKA